MQTHFRARLTLAALLAALAIGVGLSVERTSGEAGVSTVHTGGTSSVADAFPSVEAHFALRTDARR